MFAQHGFDGTIMDDLAEQCGVNMRSLPVSIVKKEKWSDNTLTALFTPIADAIVEAVGSEDTPVEKLERHIKEFAIANAENPHFAAILMREMASGGANMPVRAREQMQRVLFQLREILQMGVSQNIFKSSDPLIIHFMIVGTINLFVASIPLRKSLPEMGQAQNRNIESAYDQITKTIITSLLYK